MILGAILFCKTATRSGKKQRWKNFPTPGLTGEHGEKRVRSVPDPMHVALEGGLSLSSAVYLVLNYFLNLSEYSGGWASKGLLPSAHVNSPSVIGIVKR